MTVSAPPPSVGSRLAGRYRLDELIGTGGMAQVWAATDTVLNRTVAVKILHAHLRDDEGVAARFRLEARHVARLDHHAVVTVYDTVTTETVDAIVLEHVEGRTLRDELDQVGHLSVAETVLLATELCGAVDAAGAVGIVHRDIKPANILLPTGRIGGQGSVKIADFGIAKTDEGDRTADDLAVGTASYPRSRTAPRTAGRRPDRSVLARRRALRVPERHAARSRATRPKHERRLGCIATPDHWSMSRPMSRPRSQRRSWLRSHATQIIVTIRRASWLPRFATRSDPIASASRRPSAKQPGSRGVRAPPPRPRPRRQPRRPVLVRARRDATDRRSRSG